MVLCSNKTHRVTVMPTWRDTLDKMKWCKKPGGSSGGPTCDRGSKTMLRDVRPANKEKSSHITLDPRCTKSPLLLKCSPSKPLQWILLSAYLRTVNLIPFSPLWTTAALALPYSSHAPLRSRALKWLSCILTTFIGGLDSRSK